LTLLAGALAARHDLLEGDPRHTGALRLFAGFYEGAPELAVDAYAGTLVIHDYAVAPDEGRRETTVEEAMAFYQAALPWLSAVVVKPRRAADPAVRRGILVAGGPPAREVREDGVRYSVDLLATRDAGFYLDTRALRAWLRAHMQGKTVLNAFAYTGALGIAAQAGGATRVVQLDVNRAVLNVAKTSTTLNGFPLRKADYVTADFWVATAQMRRAGTTFDCVIIDPPFFATASTGPVDLARTFGALVNKVRPLVADGGHLVVINNALFVTGRAFLDELETLCADGYMALEAVLPVPEDVTGTAATRVGTPPADPAPFNHATKIAVLRVRRRDGEP
jgi:23S rRNA (cytosine1962-C5)-methyltransferase